MHVQRHSRTRSVSVGAPSSHNCIESRSMKNRTLLFYVSIYIVVNYWTKWNVTKRKTICVTQNKCISLVQNTLFQVDKQTINLSNYIQVEYSFFGGEGIAYRYPRIKSTWTISYFCVLLCTPMYALFRQKCTLTEPNHVLYIQYLLRMSTYEY